MRYPSFALAFVLLSLLIVARSAAGAPAVMPWDLKALTHAPKFTDDPARNSEDVKAIFYEGVPWKGQPTRVFAYYGIPKAQPGKRVPGMVLVHGGGGSAFIPWVKLWVSRGYAAIAMDTCGCISSGGFNNHPRDPQGGPPGWGGFDQIDQPVTDQWTYHAVADVILAHSLLRSFPEVDPQKTGITGISWGGYLTCIVAGVDNRFKFAAPVYGCGFLGEDSAWLPDFQRMGPEKSAKWLGLWDPSVYLARARMPMLWVDGTNDFAYPPDSLQKSYRLPRSKRTLCMRVRMPHAHGGPGENPEEILAMANTLLRRQPMLAEITKTGREGTTAWATYATASPLTKVELNYTTDGGEWQKRNWQTLPATLDTIHRRVSAEIPAGVTAYYFNLTDARNLVVSTEHETLLLAQASKARDGSITGKVTDEAAKPIAHATVQLIPALAGMQPVSIVTDRNGRFHAGKLAPGNWTLEWNARGYFAKQDVNTTSYWQSTIPTVVALTPGDRKVVTLVMKSNAILYGRVTDPDGKPVTHRLVRLVAAPDMHFYQSNPSVMCDGRGFYKWETTWSGRSGFGLYLPGKPGYGPYTNFTLENGKRTRLDFHLVRGARVSGRVLAADGKTPVAGARVSSADLPYVFWWPFRAWVEGEPRPALDGFSFEEPTAPTFLDKQALHVVWAGGVNTDAEGYFELLLNPDKAYRLQAWASMGRSVAAEDPTVLLRDGEHRSGLIFLLKPDP